MVDEKISPGQFTGILITTVLPTALLFLPAVAVGMAGRDAWMSEIIAGVFGIIVVFVSTMLGFRFPDKTIIQYSCDILRKYLGKLIGLAYLFSLLTEQRL
jgi:spore germination protein KB